MAKVGRPTDYDQNKHPALAKGLALQGYVDIDMAKALGITESTFYLWKRNHPEFSESLKAGKDSIDDKVENAMLNRALGYTITLTKEVAVSDGQGNGSTLQMAEYQEHYPGDFNAQKMWLINRRADKWRDKQEVAHSGNLTQVAIGTESLTDVQKEAIAALAIKNMNL